MTVDARAARENGPRPPEPSPGTLRIADWYVRRFMRKHFHAVRLARPERWPRQARPLIVCVNHPSWWDPLMGYLLSRRLAPERRHYAPMDARAFTRYQVLSKIGLFPVEQGTARGAAQFLRASAGVFRDPDAVLWVTPQGTFTDARARPAEFRPGLAALPRRMPRVTVLPLALEYTFWDERRPEALALLGEPMSFEGGRAEGGQGLERAMEAAQDELAGLARRRDPAPFMSALEGRSGTAGVYELWERGRALVSGKRYEAEHASVMRGGKRVR